MKALLPVLFSAFLIGNASSQKPELRFEGLRIWVTDFEKARKFYHDLLGFKMTVHSDQEAELQTGTWPIYLSKATQNNTTDYSIHERTGLSIQVFKLLPAIDRLRNHGVLVLEDHLQKNGVGISIPFRDPFGNLLSLMEVQIREIAEFEGFQIYNTGITSSDMEKAMEFYMKKLGFLAWSRDYLPQAMPLKHDDNSFAFMLHYKPGLKRHQREFRRDSEINLVFSTSDMKGTIETLESRGTEFIKKAADKAAFKDPFGNICEIFLKK